jgi:CubicO group peptidase (beta-lactamase class C family)
VDYIQGTDPLATNIYDYVVNNLRLIYVPGATFQYGPSHYYAFGVLLQRKLALAGTPMNPLEYLQTRVLTPLGIAYTDWVHDDAGNPHIPNGCTLTPRQWIKLGQFFLQQGWWNDQALIDSTRMAELRVATGPNPGHGAFLWLNRQDGYPPASRPPPPDGIPGGFIYYGGHTNIVGALGAGKNRMYVIPSRNAVVARQTLRENDRFEDTKFLATLLGE